VLSLLSTYLHASPDVQRLAVRKWKAVTALFSLLWEQRTQKLALDMVRLCLQHCLLFFFFLIIYRDRKLINDNETAISFYKNL